MNHLCVSCPERSQFDASTRRSPPVLLGVPLSLAGWMFLHPWPYDDIEGKLLPIAGWWTTLHAVQFVLFCFAGAAVWLLVEGLRGVDATVARVGAVVFAISYNVGDAVAGIATGILAGRAAGAPSAEREGYVAAVQALFDDSLKNLAFEVGIYAWVAALLAAFVVLCRSGVPWPPLLLLLPAAYFMVGDHARPYGSIVFGCFFLCALFVEAYRRGRGPRGTPAP